VPGIFFGLFSPQLRAFVLVVVVVVVGVIVFVVVVVNVVGVVVGVIVFVVVVVVVVSVVAFSVADWGSATVSGAAGLFFSRHRERAAVLAGV